MQQFCPAFNSIAIRKELDTEGRKLLSRTRCKSWNCTFCAELNRRRWRAFLLDVLPAISEIWSFHTVTMPSWIRKQKDWTDDDRTIASLSLIRANWDKLMKRLKRQAGAVQYFRVFEQHTDGTLHVHILISMHVPESELHTVKKGKKEYSYWRWLKDAAPECGFGYMTASENLKEAAAASSYATKYMTKEDLDYSEMLSKYRIRRFQSSQGIGAQSKWGKDDSAWLVKSFIDESELFGQTWYDLNLKKALKRRDFGNQKEYPPVAQYEASQAEQERRKQAKKK